MKKIIKISEQWRISIESYVRDDHVFYNGRVLLISGKLEKFFEPHFWRSKEDSDKYVTSPNWLQKLLKVSWSDKAEYTESQIIEYLKSVYEVKIKTEKLNSDLYKSLNLE